MSAIIAVLVVVAVALAAGISTQVNEGWPNYAAEQPGNVVPSDKTAPDDKSEQKNSHKPVDKHPVKREQKQNEPACVEDCAATWPHYELTPWPL
jgi:hypothetical protein